MGWLSRPEPHRTRYKPATQIDKIVLAKDVRDHPDAYQAEHAKRLCVSEKGIGHAMRRMNITYKKACPGPRSGNSASSTGRRRRTLVSIDESGFAHDKPRLYGYASKGHRCFGTQDWHGKGRTNDIGVLIGKLLPTDRNDYNFFLTSA